MTANVTNTITINGFDMYYETYGSGEPLLILHGFSGSSAGLMELFQDFIPDYQLIIPDLRGHGRSTNPSQQYTFKQTADDIFALLNHLGISECKAAGFSGGGCTLLQTAYQYPEIIKAMAIVSATTHFPQQARDIMHQVNPNTKTPEEWEVMRKIHHYGDDQIRLIWEQASMLCDHEDDLNLTPDKLKNIRAKTLIVQGDRDPIYPIELTFEMYHAIPDAYLWILPNGGHGPVAGEAFKDFTTYLKKLILED